MALRDDALRDYLRARFNTNLNRLEL